MLDPLGMDESFFFPAEVMTRRFAVGHIVKGGEPAVRPTVGPAAKRRPGRGPRLQREGPAHVTPASTSAKAKLTTEQGSTRGTIAARDAEHAGCGGGGQRSGIAMVHLRGRRFEVRRPGGGTGQISAFWMVPERDFAFIPP